MSEDSAALRGSGVYTGVLEDVSDSGARGSATAGYNFQEVYTLKATFSNLSDPEGTDFYEGWIVRRGLNFNVLSTGKVERNSEGIYENIFLSDEDLTDHNFYVLTIEPDDGDPAPADHVVEGELFL